MFTENNMWYQAEGSLRTAVVVRISREPDTGVMSYANTLFVLVPIRTLAEPDEMNVKEPMLASFAQKEIENVCWLPATAGVRDK